MITIRYKFRKEHKDYSIYLDIYIPKNKNTGEDKKRKYEFLNIYVSKEYTAQDKILKQDKEKYEIAKNISNQREMEILKGEYFPDDKKRTDDLFLFFERNENLQIPRYKSILIHLKDFCNKEKINKPTLKSFNTELCLRFQNYLINKLPKISQTTVHGYMIALKTSFFRAIKQSMLKENPITFDIPKAIETNRTTLDLNELKQLLNCQFETKVTGAETIKKSFLFACFTGLRKSDILRIKWTDIQDNQLSIIQYKTRNAKPIYNHISLSEQAVSILSTIEKNKDNDLIFWDIPSKTTVDKFLINWGYAAQIKKHIHFHASRHTFATIGLTFGIDLYTMQNLLGHSSISQTQIYAKIVNAKQRMEILKMPKLD